MNYYDSRQPIDLRTVEDIRYRTALKLKELFSKYWTPIFKQPLNKWWGYSRTNTCIIFDINDHGLSYGYFSHGDLSVNDMLTCPDTDLPRYLALTKDDFPASYKIILDRLEGSTNIVPYNQALTDMYFKYNRHSQRYYKITHKANDFISRYLSNKILSLYKYPHTPNYVNFTINNRSYIYNFKDRAFVSTPEDPITTISEHDFLEDFAKDPLCAHYY